MKKLLALVLVLGLASLASANMLIFGVEGGSLNVMENTVVTIQVTGDVACPAFGIGAVSFVASGTTFSNVALGAVSTSFDNIKNAGTLQPGTNANVFITGISGSTQLASPAVSGVLATFTVKVGAKGGTITIDDYKGTVGSPRKTTWNGVEIAAPAMAPITLNVIPEPVTIALLGLGGLFLRRRSA